MALNTALKTAIADSGLKQTYLARAMGVRTSRLSRIVRGQTDAKAEEKQALAVLLRTTADRLFNGEVAA